MFFSSVCVVAPCDWVFGKYWKSVSEAAVMPEAMSYMLHLMIFMNKSEVLLHANGEWSRCTTWRMWKKLIAKHWMISWCWQPDQSIRNRERYKEQISTLKWTSPLPDLLPTGTADAVSTCTLKNKASYQGFLQWWHHFWFPKEPFSEQFLK